MKPELLAVTSLFIVFASPGNAKDLGNFEGDPTPALAMYAAQVGFAAEKCVAQGFTTDAKGAASVVKYFARVVRLDTYRKKHPDFDGNLNLFLGNYLVAWNAADRADRQSFCDGFNDEIAVKSDGLFRWITPIEYFRRQFSPPSSADIERQRRLAVFSSVLGAAATVATAAATVSAGHDSISAAKAGDFSTSNQLMDTSTDFSRQSATFLDTSATAIPKGANAAASVLEETRSDGTVRIIRCPVVDHFFNYSAPISSPIWLTYQKVSIPCRDFMESDLEHVE